MAGRVGKGAFVDDSGWRAIRNRVKGLGQKVVKVGVVGPGADAEEESGITLARLAGVHEYGAAIQMPDGSVLLIPERSFIRASIAENERAYAGLIGDMVPKVLSGKLDEEKALGRLGARATADMKARISKGIDPPNAPSTIARKSSSKPLIDTGRLRQAITWAVVDKDEVD